MVEYLQISLNIFEDLGILMTIRDYQSLLLGLPVNIKITLKASVPQPFGPRSLMFHMK